ncbi:MAG: PAS domain S-box protein [bacterium]
MTNFSHDMLLLITNLSQIKDKDRLKHMFVEGINELFPMFDFSWSDEENNNVKKIEVCTKNNVYGYINLYHNSVLPEDLFDLLANTTQILAIFIERLEQEEDLTKHKNHLQHLVEEQTLDLINKETELLSITESTPDVIIRFAINGRILYYNNNISRLFKKVPNEILGKTIRDLYFNETIILFWEKNISEVLKQKNILEDNLEYIFNNLKVILNIRLVPEFDESKKVISVLSIIRDVTQQIIAQETAAESKKLYEIISENSSDLVCLHNEDSKYVWVSPSVKLILGYSPEELLGKYPEDYFHPDDIKKVLNPSINKVALDKMFDHVEYRIKNISGDYLWFDTVVKPIINENGKVVYIQSSSRNITKRKTAEDKLTKIRKEDKAKKIISDILTELISNNIKIPVVNIISELEKIKQFFYQTGIYDNFNYIENNINKIKTTIEKFLNYSYLDNGKITLSVNKINIKQLIQSVFEEYKNQLTEHTIFEHCDSVLLFSDYNSLKQIISVLIENAVVYANTSKIVVDLLNNEKNNLIIQIKNNQMKVDEKYLNKLFSSEDLELDKDYQNEFGINFLLIKQLVKLNNYCIYVIYEDDNCLIFNIEIPYYKRVKIDPEPENVKRGMINSINNNTNSNG